MLPYEAHEHSEIFASQIELKWSDQCSNTKISNSSSILNFRVHGEWIYIQALYDNMIVSKSSSIFLEDLYISTTLGQ